MYRDTNRGGDRGGRKFGGRPSGGSSRFGSRDGGNDRGGIVRKMHPATCEECGASCEVPFRPSGSRPIYCSKHFEGKEPQGPRSDSRNSFKPRFEDKGSNNTQVMGELKNLNVKMDKLLSALEALLETNKIT